MDGSTLGLWADPGSDAGVNTIGLLVYKGTPMRLIGCMIGNGTPWTEQLVLGSAGRLVVEMWKAKQADMVLV